MATAISGIIGGVTGKAILHPIDTVKAKLQVQQINNTKVARGKVIQSIVQETVKAEGIGGLYRGLSISILGSVPGSALYFGSYEFFKSLVLEKEFFSDKPFLAYFCGGMFAEFVACALFVPVDVIKERRQV